MALLGPLARGLSQSHNQVVARVTPQDSSAGRSPSKLTHMVAGRMCFLLAAELRLPSVSVT